LLLSLAAGAMIYLAVKRMYGPRTAICALLAFAVAFPAVFFGAAGNIDRDCLHLFLIPLCIFAVYFMRSHTLVWGAMVVLSCVVLWYEWGFYGPLTVVLYCLPFVVVTSGRSLWKTGLESWQQIVLTCGIAAGGLLAVFYWQSISGVVEGFQGTSIAEMQRLDGRELLAYLMLIPFMIVGILVLFRRKARRHLARADMFVVLWLVTSVMLGLAFSRWYLWGIPAFCILAGIGLAWVWKKRLMPKIALATLVAIVVLFSGYYAWNVDLQDPRVSATREYQDAMLWLKQNSQEGDVVLAWWDWGYMIENLSGRDTVMNNGHWEQHNIVLLSKALWSADDGRAAQWMIRTGANWLVLYQDFPPLDHAARMAFGAIPSDQDRQASLAERAFDPDYSSSRLPVVYRSPNIIILACCPPVGTA